MAGTLIQAGQVNSFYGMLEAVSTISQSNITLSGLQDLNGATGADGDRVFVSGQTDPTEDGVYLMRATAWERADDAFDDPAVDLGSMIFKIEDGTYAGQYWGVTVSRGAGVVGTDDLPIAIQIDAPDATEVYNEEATFTAGEFTATIANTPITGTDRVFRNGVRQNPGASDDYEISGTTITFAKKLRANDVVLVDYKYTP